MRWAIVIGIDEYGDGAPRLGGAVGDALAFRDWALAEDGGGVPGPNLRLLLGRRDDDPGPAGEAALPPTKDNIVTTISEVVGAVADEAPERLYFYFAGHGITARVANRDESALVTAGFDQLHTDHSLAVRSLAEHLETTPFKDQFLFLDACRDEPWPEREFEIGRWPAPRRRDPGAPPVQQFILYATSPGLEAEEVGFPGEEHGAFTRTLLDGLRGAADAKAWSWERSRYEVRWDRLAGFVQQRMREQAGLEPGAADRDAPIQIPQDTGARGVAGRDRDIAVTAFPSGGFPHVELTVALAADARYDEAEVTVLDGIGEPVVRALGVTGAAQRFQLAPKTYAVRATTTAPAVLVGTYKAPIDLYRAREVEIELQPHAAREGGSGVVEPVGPGDLAAAGRQQPSGTIAIASPDPLAVAEIRDETGDVVAVKRPSETLTARPGFYQVRRIGPEATQDERFVALTAGERERVRLQAERPERYVAQLVTALGGRVQKNGYLIPAGADERVSWALPATVVATGIAAALRGEPHAGLGAGDLRAALDGAPAGVAVLAVARDGAPAPVGDLRVRMWPAGEPRSGDEAALVPSDAGVGGVVAPIGELAVSAGPLTYWVSLRAALDAPLVPVPVIRGRLATLVAQLDEDRLRLFQYHPRIEPRGEAGDDLRRVEYLERMLTAGRLDVAEPLAAEIADGAADDPFGGLVAGYVLLRLGLYDALDELASAILSAAPGLSDAYILRGEHAARIGRLEASAQAFADAVSAGIPAFGEGLTRLVEGLRSTGYTHPRGSVVRHMFQRHVRGSMWASFTPPRRIAPGQPAISAGDLGFEA